MTDIPAIKDRRVISLLNKVLGMEISAAAQFRLHARLVRRRGDPAIAARLEDMAREEDRHAETLIDLIAASGYTPRTNPTPVYWPRNPLKILVQNRKNEILSIRAYEKLAGMFRSRKDLRALMLKTAGAERKHIRTLDRLIKRPVKE